DGSPGPRPQGPARSLEGAAGPGEAGQRPEPDRQRSPGDRPEGAGGFFTARLAAGGRRNAFPRRGDGVPAPSFAARVRASRPPPRTLLAAIPGARLPPSPAPPRGAEAGTVISPPGRASGNPVPPEGLPQISAGRDAALPAGADSLACRPAP